MRYLAKGLFNHFTFFILKSQTNATISVTFRTFSQQNISQNLFSKLKLYFIKIYLTFTFTKRNIKENIKEKLFRSHQESLTDWFWVYFAQKKTNISFGSSEIGNIPFSHRQLWISVEGLINPTANWFGLYKSKTVKVFQLN